MELITKRVDELIPYENNPRINDDAYMAVAESIRQCGYIAPIIVDENNVILAGHTRFRAITEVLDLKEVPVMVAAGLTELQKDKYRILDNKTNEFAQWDLDMLREEVKDLDFSFDFGIGSLLQKADNIQEVVEKQEAKKMQKITKKCTCPRCGAEIEE